ncbi:iron only hydrogenase large subunit [Iocasia frigidifontis]|uniref:Iron only hydrogenase large subunit n=1 Tax=Iocasia fonsfrigidae TaxID=2682810 RepID=A0A8A7KE06_9FIRM|nr:[Fe-Fe] hydrogenase large subunit C-terminal domain-containing protein [Iocasia fonsfrigidae]QTL99651.1 iron only hydrogenase large subunit [Iocasia fonsfrigidae]
MIQQHSVLLKEELCEGCTNCVKDCPTKAIRVHQGKATIKEELCIDCAECIRTCAYHAKYTRTDSIEDIADYDYPVALVPPSFYGQFIDYSPGQVIKGLYKLGFKGVYDVAMAAEALTYKTIDFLKNTKELYISSSCPVVVRLIKLLYPELIDQLIPFKPPTELMAQSVRKELLDSGLSEQKLGIFLVTPCPGKTSTVHNPLGVDRSFIDKAIPVDKVYHSLLEVMDKKNSESEGKKGLTPYLGIKWGQSGGEVDLIKPAILNKTIAVSGIHNVKDILEEISRNNITDIRYCELSACTGGCVGGVLNVINPFQAKYNLKKLAEEHNKAVNQDYCLYSYQLSSEFKPVEVARLDSDIEKAMEKLAQLEKEIDLLPGLDCAACGAPDCQTLAEDIVTGKAKRSDCIFILREQVEDLADQMSELAHSIPPIMRKKRREEKAGTQKEVLKGENNKNESK